MAWSSAGATDARLSWETDIIPAEVKRCLSVVVRRPVEELRAMPFFPGWHYVNVDCTVGKYVTQELTEKRGDVPLRERQCQVDH